MKRYAKTVHMSLAAALLLTGAACSKENKEAASSTQPAGTAAATAAAAASKGPLKEISVEIFDRGVVPPEEGTIADNRWTRWVNEQVGKLGLKVNYYPVPRNEEITKVNLLLAAGEAPDMLYTYNDDSLKQWANSGGLHELDEAVKQYGPNIQSKLWDQKPGVKDAGIVNGKLYAIAGGTTIYTSNMLFMRKDWLDKVGLGIPKTPEEFYQALKAFKDKDPGGAGKDNVVPLTVSMSSTSAQLNVAGLLSAFGVEDDLAYIDGKLVPRELQSGYKNYLVYMNKLYKEELIATEFALDTDGKRSKEQTFGGKAGAWSGNYNWINVTSGAGERLNHDSVQNDPNVEWHPVAPFADQTGKIHQVVTPPYGYRIIVPKTSKKVNEVVQYIDWMVKEGADTLFFGVENEHYTLKDGIRVPKDTAYNAKTLSYINYEISAVRPFTFDGNYFKALDGNTKFGAISEAAAKINREGARNKILFDRPIAAASKYKTELDKLTQKAVVQAITGADPERIYEDFKAAYLKNGGQEYIDEMTGVYKEMNKL
ncbi:MAG: family 1 extracellular solute-binding protein [Paenibacillaceae bacterium]|jgi:putative aldouronate transport system substrate-binding protein|nr:family 1 extracellular solute-binding protein [Paenibacillaceae bacterium]